MNGVVHFEIHAADPEKMISFYQSIFDWKFEKWKGGEFEYWVVMTGDRNSPGSINGGLMRRRGEVPADGCAISAFVCTVQVKSVDETIKKAEAAGGKLALPKFKIADMAWQAYLKDIDGNIFGIHEPISK